MQFRRSFVATLLFISLLARAADPAPALSRFEFSNPEMGTVFRIVLYAPDKDSAAKASAAAFARIEQLNQVMSDYKDDSEVMQLCKKAGGDAVPVSAELFSILESAVDLSARSEGAFDVTCGPIVQLWRRARRTHQLPDASALEHAKALTGYRMVELNKKERSVRLQKAGMRLDFGAIAKGDAADQALAMLKRSGIESALVAAGGEIAVSHAPPGAEGWLVGIAPLDNPEDKPDAYLLLHDAGASTSGDYEQHVEIGGVRYSHVVDPRTGQALTGHHSVTIVARDCRSSDSLGTTVSVLGPEKGIALIETLEGAAAYIAEGTSQGPKYYQSRRWQDLPKGQPKN